MGRLAEALDALKAHFLRKRVRLVPIEDRQGLAEFIEGRASLVAQTSLYGYIKTRAGTRFPELFENEKLLESINIAKWQIWCACVSDLSTYAGALIYAVRADAGQVRALMGDVLKIVADRTGQPSEAGDNFREALSTVFDRLATVDFAQMGDLEKAFAQSPDALVHWSPIVDELKMLDEEIVRNSIRFRWQEPRRDLRSALKVESLLAE